MTKNRFKKILQNCWPFLTYLLISIILLFPILRQDGIPFKYDWSWPLFDLRDFWRQLLDSSSNGLLAVLGKYPTAILGSLPFPPSLGVKFFLIVIHTLAGYGFYLFILKRVDNKLAAFVAGIVYAFSPYIFIRTIVGFIYSLIAYAVLPWLILVYSKKQKRFWHFLLAGFLLSIIFAQIQAGILTVLLLIVNLFVVLILRVGFKKRLSEFIFVLVAFFVVNLPWLILYLLKSKTIAIPSGGAATTLNFIASLPHSFRNIFMLSDHHITSGFFYPLAHNKFFLAGFALVWLVAFCAIFSKKNRELILTLIISSLLVLPFVKGPTGIFGQFYIWFYNHFPQIAVFRETYHFEFLYAISLCVLFAFGLDWIWQKINSWQSAVSGQRLKTNNFQSNSKKLQTANCKLQTANLLRIGAKTLFAGSAIFIIAPYLTFDYAGYLKMQKIPSGYFKLNEFFEENKDYCNKIYYPPGTGFLYFKGDQTPGASNFDVIASSFGISYLTDGMSVLNLPNKEMFYRNELVSQFYEQKDSGEFVNLLSEGSIDCVVLRLDTESKYFEASNLWREKDSKIYKKWMNPDMLSLAKNKQGLVLDKQFGENIYIFKSVSSQQSAVSSQDQADNTANRQPLTYLPITDWANNYAYYKDGWSRGRYDFWRKHLFTQLRQDFIYTDKQDSHLTAKIDQRGLYEVWTRYLTGGTPGSFQLQITNHKSQITKDPGEEKFTWRKLGDVDIADGKIEITNISGENAIADIVLIKK